MDVEDHTKRLVEDGEMQGELLVRGPWVTACYTDSTRGEFVDGWLCTGDIASLDLDGNIIIRDRSKDVIKSGGEWISSVDLEKHISILPEVYTCAVVAQPHPKWDERPVCVVVAANAGSGLSENKWVDLIRSHCADAFAKVRI